jgi:FkbM family methyltransferase
MLYYFFFAMEIFYMSEEFVTQYIHQLIPSKRIALDIGANIGRYTIPMAEKFEKVYAFEPHEENQKQLWFNLNRFKKTNVEVIGKAISNSTGSVILNTNPHNIGGHTLSEKVATHIEWGFQNSQTIEVPSITLDEFCADKDVEFMKIDIEGAEDFIFEGATETLKRKNLNIMIEVHNEVNLPKLFEVFKDNGFSIGGLGLSFGSDGTYQKLIEVNSFVADNHYLIRK